MQLRDSFAADSAVVLIPVLARPHRALPVAQSVRDTSPAKILFVATDTDRKQIAAIRKVQRKIPGVGLLIVERHDRGDYARKINAGVRATDDAWVFQGADDLTFHPGWLDEALATAAARGARVIGTQDKCNPRVRTGRHSTHSLVARSYIRDVGTGDETGKMLHEGYWHGFVDDELVWLATRSGEYAFSPRSIVEHHHPLRRDETNPIDATYEKALDRREFARDRALFRHRARMIDPARRHNRRRMR